MIRKKDLEEDIDNLKNDVNNLRKVIRDTEKIQKVYIGEGKEPQKDFWYATRGQAGLVYTEITIKEIIMSLLKHLNLEIIETEIRQPEESFKIKPIKQKKGK